MITFTAKLLKVDSSTDQRTAQPVHRLIFQSEKYDRGLEEFVPASQPIKLHETDFHFLPIFQKLIGHTITVPVTLTAMDRNIYYKTNGTGFNIYEDVTNKALEKILPKDDAPNNQNHAAKA